MTPPRRATHLAASALLALAPILATATEPPFGRVEIDGGSERPHDNVKGWVELPRNERVREIAISERCSAIGAPRRRYLVADGQLWLRGLYRCGGNIQLGAVVCRMKERLPLFARTAQLTVDASKVTAIAHQIPICPAKD